MSRLVVIAFLGVVSILVWRFGRTLSWVQETVLGGLPCVVHAGRHYESYMTLSHPGLCGVTIRYVAAESPPGVTFSLSTVPEDERLISDSFNMGESSASVRFQPLWLPPRSPLRITLDLQDGRDDLFLDCREVHREGRISERVTVLTHHRYGSTFSENITNWLRARVVPFAPSGISDVFFLLLLLAPVGSALTLLVILRRR
jgi:hypothetical protein